MENKTFTVIDTRTNSKVILENSQASTLGELKADLHEKGISTEGMIIQEALTKVVLMDDNSVLPHDVPWKGTITNNLVFRMTTAENKTKSGIDRAALYQIIKDNGFQKEIQDTFGKNFTQVSSAALDEFIYGKQLESENCEDDYDNTEDVDSLHTPMGDFADENDFLKYLLGQLTRVTVSLGHYLEVAGVIDLDWKEKQEPEGSVYTNKELDEILAELD